MSIYETISILICKIYLEYLNKISLFTNKISFLRLCFFRWFYSYYYITYYIKLNIVCTIGKMPSTTGTHIGIWLVHLQAPIKHWHTFGGTEMLELDNSLVLTNKLFSDIWLAAIPSNNVRHSRRSVNECTGDPVVTQREGQLLRRKEWMSISTRWRNAPSIIWPISVELEVSSIENMNENPHRVQSVSNAAS